MIQNIFNKLTDYLNERPNEKVIRVSISDYNGNTQTLEGRNVSRCQDCYSVAKAFTMTAIGLLYDRGMITPEEKICDVFRDELPANMHPDWEKSTVHMALLHQLGLPEGFLDLDADPANNIDTFGTDYLTYVLSHKPDPEPGTVSKYNDAGYYLLSRIVEKKVGMHIEDYMQRELFGALRFGEVAWGHCPHGYAIGGSALYVTAEDIARLGALYLRAANGDANGLLSTEWYNIVTERGYTFSPDKEKKLYVKDGMYGQAIAFYPQAGIALGLHAFECDPYKLCEFVRDCL